MAVKETAQMKRDRMSQAKMLDVPGWDGGIRLDLPLPTSVNAIWRRSKFATYLSPSYKNWMQRADEQLQLQRAGKDWPCIEGPFNVAVMMPVQKQYVIDLDNRIKASLDWAQKAGLVANDKFANLLAVEWGPVPQGVRIWLVPAESF